MDEIVCRLCGIFQNEENEMFILSDELKNLIEFYCRINMQYDESITEQICFDCNSTIINFARFSEKVKEVQTKYLLEFNTVKVESQDFPTINEETTEFYLDETKPEESAANEEMEDEKVSSNKFSSPEDSTSDFEVSLACIKRKLTKNKKKRKKSTGKKMGRPKKIVLQEQEMFLKEVPPNDRYKNGTMKRKALVPFEGKMWKDINFICTVCNMDFAGPYQFHQHSKICNFQTYICPHCDKNQDSFYNFLNHSLEHQNTLSFCCVSPNIY
jgi:Zinc-finger associated domain (zf-AD)